VTSDGDTPRVRRTLGTGRLEAFSDGVFGFASTLLVADLALHPPGGALEQVLRAWPSYLAYVVSFLTIGAGWLAHTTLTDRLARADQILLRLNLLLLLVVVFLPFPTRLVASALHHTGSERVFVTMYGLNLLAIRAAGIGLAAYARRGHLYEPAGEGEELQSEQRQLLPVVVAYAVAILLGLALPSVAVAVYFALAVYLVWPSRGLHRSRPRGHSSSE
jgi:TMEM175 potassium channel family protein